MPRIPTNIAETVGNTPMVALTRLLPDGLDVELYGKLEAFNPGGSVKDRIGVAMLDAAERDGLIEPGRTTIVEATSGNTGIALAFCCAAKGYDLSIFLPQGMSREREALLRLYGAQVEIVESLGGMNEAVDAARAAARDDDVFLPDQFSNPANPEAHRTGTGPEILAALDGKVDVFVAGVGTGGTITGVGEALKAHNPKATVIGVEPQASPVLSGGAPGPAPHPGHRRRLRARRARPRRARRGHDLLGRRRDRDRPRWPPRARASSPASRAAPRCGRPRGRPAARVARQAHRHRPAGLGRALHLGAVLRPARGSGRRRLRGADGGRRATVCRWHGTPPGWLPPAAGRRSRASAARSPRHHASISGHGP